MCSRNNFVPLLIYLLLPSYRFPGTNGEWDSDEIYLIDSKLNVNILFFTFSIVKL